jgi:hypothetical protein
MFMSPQMMLNQPSGFDADIYYLGIVWYYMIHPQNVHPITQKVITMDGGDMVEYARLLKAGKSFTPQTGEYEIFNPLYARMLDPN